MEEEYEIQHYGFTIAQLKQESKWFICLIYNYLSYELFIPTASDMIHDEVDKACEVLVESISTTLIDSNVASEIDRKKNILASEIKDLFKESLEEMGNVMTECFSIPPNVTLSTDQYKLKCLDTSEEELQELHDEHLKKFMMVCRISV